MSSFRAFGIRAFLSFRAFRRRAFGSRAFGIRAFCIRAFGRLGHLVVGHLVLGRLVLGHLAVRPLPKTEQGSPPHARHKRDGALGHLTWLGQHNKQTSSTLKKACSGN